MNEEINKWWSSLSIKEMKDLIAQYTTTWTFNGYVINTYSLSFLPDFFVEQMAKKEGIISIN
jgi:hypothetical protein